MQFDGVGGGDCTIVYKKKQGYKMIRHYMMGELLGEGQQGKVCPALFGLLFCGRGDAHRPSTMHARR